MSKDSLDGHLADVVALVHAAPAPGVVLQMHDEQHVIRREDVALAVQVSHIFAIGENPSFVDGDALERDMTHDGFLQLVMTTPLSRPERRLPDRRFSPAP